ncbi:8209_t:CDS:2 [Cetraspora pellucida]|uniref:8209_t:CDS:1 n=1 Tax=Cetraspora pellucida TaxID=1433469 RepID=A0A9N8ZRW9_9GLOM|nr:8209_t:CDS:2 [Cetraspora pellucida]
MLRVLCRAEGLQNTGSKKELIERLASRIVSKINEKDRSMGNKNIRGEMFEGLQKESQDSKKKKNPAKGLLENVIDLEDEALSNFYEHLQMKYMNDESLTKDKNLPTPEVTNYDRFWPAEKMSSKKVMELPPLKEIIVLGSLDQVESFNNSAWKLIAAHINWLEF